MSVCLRDRPDPAFKEYEHTYHRVAQLNRRECTASLACTHTKQKDERASPSPSISLLTPPQDQRQVGKKHPAKLSSLSQPNHPRCTTTTTPKRPCLRSARSQKQSRQGAKKPTSPRAAQRALGFHTPLDPAWARRDNASQVQVHSPRKSVATVVSFPFLALFSNELVEPLGLLSNASVLHRTSQVLFAIHQPAPLLHKPNATQRNAATTTCMNRIALRVKDSSRRNSD